MVLQNSKMLILLEWFFQKGPLRGEIAPIK
jgi:hypothetical protein